MIQQFAYLQNIISNFLWDVWAYYTSQIFESLLRVLIEQKKQKILKDFQMGKTILSAIFIIIIGGAAYLYFNFNSLLVRTAERIATNALGVNVNIGGIELSLSDKRAIVSGIKVANPSGYKGRHIITTDRVEIALNTASAELINFKDINVTGSTLYVEVSEKGINLKDLKALAQKKEQKEAVGAEQVQVIIKSMVVDATTLKTHVAFLDKDLPEVKMPAVSFSNIGGANGASASVAVQDVVSQYMTSAYNFVQRQGILSGIDIPNMSDLKNNVEGLSRDILDKPKGALDDAKKDLNNAAEGLKGIFE